MANNVHKTPGAQGVDDVDGKDQSKSEEEIRALLEQAGAPMVEPGRARTQQVDALLERAGLTGSVSGVSGARGVGAVDSVERSSTVNRSAPLEGLNPTHSNEIAPPSPPRVELTEELKIGAETFVANIDQVFNEMFFKNGEVPPELQQSLLSQGITGDEALFSILFNQPSDSGSDSANDRGDRQAPPSVEAQSGALGSDGNVDTTEGPTPVDPPVLDPSIEDTSFIQYIRDLPGDAPPVEFDPETGIPKIDTNITFDDVFSAGNFKSIFEGILANGGTSLRGLGGVSQDDIRHIAEVSADMLVALFLKLNINDPNNSPEVHNMLHAVSTELRKQGLDENKAKNELATLKIEHAQKLAENVKTAGIVVTIITIIISLIITVFTFGAAAPAAIAASAAVITAVQTAAQVTVQMVLQMIVELVVKFVVTLVVEAAKAAAQMVVMIVIMALITLVLQVSQACANQASADASLDAQEAQNGAERAKHWAEKHQAVIEEEAAIMKLIMEAKNQMVDAVIKMLNAAFGTQQKVMAAGMVR